jgi:hypothetical protein
MDSPAKMSTSAPIQVSMIAQPILTAAILMADMNASVLMDMKWLLMKISVLISTSATIQQSVRIQTLLA